MKKSTLITTIAMIVVVVVALSTATYAWFSSANQSTAKTTISTQSSSDWTIYKGSLAGTSLADGANTVSWSAGGQQIELNSTMAGGLYSPTGEISAYVSSPASTAVSIPTADLPSWMTARYSYDKEMNWATFYNQSVSGAAKSTEGGAGAIHPDILRVVNSKSSSGVGSSKGLQLNVVINLGSSPTDATKYAAASISFYAGLTHYTSKASSTAEMSTKVLTTGYSYPKATSSTGVAIDAALAAASDSYVAGAVVEADTAVTATSGATRPAYQSVATDTTYIHTYAATGDQVLDNCGVQVNESYILYTVDVCDVFYGAGATIVLYTWMDGWLANDGAAGSSLSVVYAFSTKA